MSRNPPIGGMDNNPEPLIWVIEPLKPENQITITAFCPVDLTVTDPEGFIINKQSNEIPGATYIETDLNGDGDPDDQIIIPDRKIGDYQITVIPEPDAELTDIYTLEVSTVDTAIVLAENVPISDIPAQPYVIESTEEGVFQKIVDTSPPTIESVTLDAYTTIPDASIHVTVEATDNVGVTSVTADGVALVETGSTWEGDITAPSTTGDYTLTIRAEDAAGNAAETIVDYSVVTPIGGLGAGISPRSTTASVGDTINYNIIVSSTENFDDKIRVYVSMDGLPDSYKLDMTAFDWIEQDVQVRAGENKEIPLVVTIPAGETGRKVFRIKAESTCWTSKAYDSALITIT
jgi:hypothetical protein